MCPLCSYPSLMPHMPTCTRSSCHWQRWSQAQTIQMAQPLSETLLLLVVPRGGCPPLHFWRRKLGFATSEEEEEEVFKGSLLW